MWTLGVLTIFFGFYPDPLLNTVEVSVNNFQALEFYSSLGFNSVGLRPLYYKNDNVRSDAKVLKGNAEYIQKFKVK